MNEFFLPSKKQENKEKDAKTMVKDEKSRSFSDFSKILREYTLQENLNKSQMYINPENSNNVPKKQNSYEKIFVTSWGFSKFGQLGSLCSNSKSNSPINLEYFF